MNRTFRIEVILTAAVLLALILTACGADDSENASDVSSAAGITAGQASTSAQTQPEVSETQPDTAAHETAASVSAEYRLSARSSSFSSGDTFELLLNIDCDDFCSGCCYISFDESVFTCNRVALTGIEGLNGIIDDDELASGLAVISLYSALPADIVNSQVAKLEFTVNENIREDTKTSISFSDGTVCIVGTNPQGTAISDITDNCAAAELNFIINER